MFESDAAVQHGDFDALTGQPCQKRRGVGADDGSAGFEGFWRRPKAIAMKRLKVPAVRKIMITSLKRCHLISIS